MDPFDYRDEAVRPTRNTSSMVWNILTIIVILMALCLAAIFILVFINPQVSFNPFPAPLAAVFDAYKAIPLNTSAMGLMQFSLGLGLTNECTSVVPALLP